MEEWKAGRLPGPVDQPGMICIGMSAGDLNDTKKESFQALVITPPPDDATNEDRRLEKGLTRLIELLQAKLSDLQSGNAS